MNFILNHHIIFDYKKAKRRFITNEKVHLTPSKYIKIKQLKEDTNQISLLVIITVFVNRDLLVLIFHTTQQQTKGNHYVLDSSRSVNSMRNGITTVFEIYFAWQEDNEINCILKG